MIDGLCRDDDIADVQVIAQGAGHAGIDEVRDVEAVHEDLNAQTGVDLTDAALHDNR